MERRTQHESLPSIRFPDGFRYMQGSQEFVTYPEHATLRVWYDDTPGEYGSHYHSAVEIILPLRGEVNYRLPGREYHVQAGEALIIPPNCVHALSMAAGSARHLLLFEPEMIFGMRDMRQVSDMLNAPVYLSAQPELRDETCALLRQLVERYERREPMWNSACYALLLQMYARLAAHCLATAGGGDAAGDDIDSDVINSARLYIDNNCTQPITLEDMAAFSGFSKYYFSRVFKRQLGVTFSEYLRERRVRLAEDLLIHSRRSVREIAEDAGFGSIATFNRVFRAARSCPPTQYREIYGNEGRGMK